VNLQVRSALVKNCRTLWYLTSIKLSNCEIKMFISLLALRRTIICCPTIIRNCLFSTITAKFSHENSTGHNKLNKLSVLNVTNHLDPKLKEYLIKAKKTFDSAMSETVVDKPVIEGVEIHKIQKVAFLAMKLLQAENELLELQTMSNGKFVLSHNYFSSLFKFTFKFR